MAPADARLAETVRREASSVVALLYRLTGDFAVAEEAVQDALVSALQVWRRDGIPDRPGAWLTTVAKNRATDLLRHRRRTDHVRSRLTDELRWEVAEPQTADADERVPMLFGCCHPALALPARLALTLRAVVGLTTAQIGEAFLVSEATVAQRIVRAKRKITYAGIPLVVPSGTDLPGRLDDVLTVVYLTYNAGFLASPTDAVGVSLADDAVWLAELVTTRLPDQPETWGLLALLTLQQARVAARFDGSGRLVLLRDQDRSCWDHAAIARAERYLERAAVWRAPGRFQLQAAIAACHASAPSGADTDWLQILTLYDVLTRYDRSPVVALKRAIALAEYAGADAALPVLDSLRPDLESYHLWHAGRAELLRRLGRAEEARDADRRALELATRPTERALLLDRVGP